MTPEAFIAKWSESTTKERAASQEHFIDLCRVLEEKTPNEADPTGEWYAFEKGVEKTGAGRGWADVWKRAHFGWEYKSKSGGRTSTMAGALKQLQQYALALESPPLLIVSDIDTIEIHTAFQNAVQDVHIIRLEELTQPEKLDLLRSAFADPERLRPSRTRNQVTEAAAGEFADLAFALRGDGHDSQAVAHFLNKILFCMFAEDVGILKTRLFTDIAEKGVEHPEHFNAFIQRLFQAMQKGGPFGTEIIDWMNGGLFDDDATLPLTLDQIRTVRDLARMDWSQIEPAIFGTLFERGLDPAKRSQLGAHYTDPESIMRLVNPTIVEPLLNEWRAVRAEIASQMKRMEKVKTKDATKKRRQAANNAFQGFLENLRNFRVLDPACGSGNFLYLALQALKDIEHRANIEAEALGLHRQNPLVGPEAVLGLEINTYAAELARVTVWIGEIQWMLAHGYSLSKDPILKPLDTIEQRDALINDDGTEAKWPTADVIIGNPPFLGAQRMLRELGEYANSLRELYQGRVAASADLVTFWYEKARCQLQSGKATRVGLVATQSIRKGSSRAVLDAICQNAVIYRAWSDEPWVNDGADVRVSLICFARPDGVIELILDGNTVEVINSDLSAGSTERNLDVTKAKRLTQNLNIAIRGSEKGGPFEIEGDTAREWLTLPANPNGNPNSDVLRPWVNGMDVTRRLRDIWLIDFGVNVPETQAAMYEAPFEYAVKVVKPARASNPESRTAKTWWLHRRSGAELRSALAPLSRYIATPRVAKHRFFIWLDRTVMPDSRLFAISRDDDISFGILHSRIHEIWTLHTCSWHGVGNDPTYNSATCFEQFAFPDGLTPDLPTGSYSNDHTEDIAIASRELVLLRDNWLNPPEWVDRISEVVEGYPERLIPKKDHVKDLKQRTLTNLYNEMPTWLVNAHKDLDEAVAAAYGWSADLTDEEILANLLNLNIDRASAAGAGELSLE